MQNAACFMLCTVFEFQSWLSGGPATVCVDAMIDPTVVASHISFLKDCIARYLEGPREHLASFGKLCIFFHALTNALLRQYSIF